MIIDIAWDAFKIQFKLNLFLTILKFFGFEF